MISGLKTGMMPKMGGAGKTALAKSEKTSPASVFANDGQESAKNGGFAERLGTVERNSERAGTKSPRGLREARREDEKSPKSSSLSQSVPQSPLPSNAAASPQRQELPDHSEESAPSEGFSAVAEKRKNSPTSQGTRVNAQAGQEAEVEESSVIEDGENLTDVSKNLNSAPSTQAVPADGTSAASESFKAPMRPGGAEGAVTSADVVTQAQAEQVQVRRQAMQTFMSRMQNEFGIPPEKIVDAFTRMDDAALMRPPEESAKDFLANLEVPRAQQAKAAELYGQMLNTTGEAALNEKIIGREAGLQMRVLSPREEALRKLNESIDQLNDAFAMRNTKVMASPSAPMDSTIKAQLAVEQMNAELLKMERDSLSQAGQPTDENDESNALLGASTSQESSSSKTASAMMAGGGLAAGGFESMNSGAGQANAWQGPSTGGNAPAPVSEAVSSFASRVKAPSIGESAKSGARKPLTESSALTTNTESAVASADSSGLAGAANAMPGAEKSAMPTGPSAMMINRPTPTAQDEKENVNELIRQAQLAIKKGGGEIKMDLKPEGMGQIKLKVSVENGQVNVQMLTDSDAAKRLLEKGLHELKSNLAAEQLKVDTMKVDVGRELQKHMDGSADQGREQTRQFANDVMSQMRDQRQAFQQGFMENRGWRQYPRGNEMGEVGLERTSGNPAQQADARSRARRNDAGRLNLVA